MSFDPLAFNTTTVWNKTFLHRRLFDPSVTFVQEECCSGRFLTPWADLLYHARRFRRILRFLMHAVFFSSGLRASLAGSFFGTMVKIVCQGHPVPPDRDMPNRDIHHRNDTSKYAVLAGTDKLVSFIKHPLTRAVYVSTVQTESPTTRTSLYSVIIGECSSRQPSGRTPPL